MHLLARLLPDLLSGLQMCSEVGQVFELVGKDAVWGICCSSPGNIHKVVWVRDGDGSQLLHLGPCMHQDESEVMRLLLTLQRLPYYALVKGLPGPACLHAFAYRMED